LLTQPLELEGWISYEPVLLATYIRPNLWKATTTRSLTT